MRLAISPKAVFFYIVSPVIIAATFVTFELNADRHPDPLLAHAETIAEVRRLILYQHVDDVTDEAMLTGALSGMVRATGDAYGTYLDAKAYEAISADNDGEFGGLGVRISLQDGELTVISPIYGTPAARAGLRPQDKIVAIDGTSTERFTTDLAMQHLRGKPGTKVTITILRQGAPRFDVTLEREVIKVASVKWPRIVDRERGLGYVHLSQFQEHSAEHLEQAVKDLMAQGMKALVLDLRGNPGGLLEQAGKCADLFLESGVIVTTRGRHKRDDVVIEAKGPGTIVDLPIAVLIDEGSASASEILAGALQDHRRALVVGERSYGKGSVQSIFPLADKKTGVKLTTAYYYTPSGRNISRTATSRGGIAPDLPVALSASERTDVRHERDQLELEETGSLPAAARRVYRDPQLEAALGALRGERRYGTAGSGSK